MYRTDSCIVDTDIGRIQVQDGYMYRADTGIGGIHTCIGQIQVQNGYMYRTDRGIGRIHTCTGRIYE